MSALIISGPIYFILTLQVASGFSPFYRYNIGGHRATEHFTPFFIAMALTGLGATVATIFILFFVATFFWAGLRVRRLVEKHMDWPGRWQEKSRKETIFDRWPMFAFDAWTIGLAAVPGVIHLLNR